MCLVHISEQTTNFALYNISVIGFYNRDDMCLLRITNWVFKQKGLRFVLKGFNEVPESVCKVL